jgi:ABC-2 type transport system ATP-binding protein
MNVPLIEVQDLSKTYIVAEKQAGFVGTLRHFVRRRTREVQAVRNVSFTIQSGECIGFLGGNGAGKTTTLKMLAGLLAPTSGTCSVAGFVPFERRKDYLRRVTLVMGNKQQLLWDLPPTETFRLNAAIYGISDADAATRIKDLCGILELEDKLRTPVRKLSLGERMKAELVASLIHRPRLLFLDEPTLGLDVNAQAAVRAFLRQYNKTTEATIILTSHYMQDITALCERVIVMHDGSLVHDGTLKRLKERFGAQREIRLTLDRPVARTDLERYGHVISLEGLDARIAVPEAGVLKLLPSLLANLPITDLTVQDSPIEEAVGRAMDGDDSVMLVGEAAAGWADFDDQAGS